MKLKFEIQYTMPMNPGLCTCRKMYCTKSDVKDILEKKGKTKTRPQNKMTLKPVSYHSVQKLGVHKDVRLK